MSFVHNRKTTFGDVLNYSALGLISLISLFPFFYVLSISFTDPQTYVPLKFYIFPEKWSLSSYEFILSTRSFIDSLNSTIFVTVVGTLFNLLFTFTMAYGLTKKGVPGRKVFLGVVIFTLFLAPGLFLRICW